MKPLLFRYTVGRLYNTGKSFSALTDHIFLNAAVKELERRQNNESCYAMNWGNQWAILDRKKELIIPMSLLVEIGITASFRDGSGSGCMDGHRYRWQTVSNI